MLSAIRIKLCLWCIKNTDARNRDDDDEKQRRAAAEQRAQREAGGDEQSEMLRAMLADAAVGKRARDDVDYKNLTAGDSRSNAT